MDNIYIVREKFDDALNLLCEASGMLENMYPDIETEFENGEMSHSDVVTHGSLVSSFSNDLERYRNAFSATGAKLLQLAYNGHE